MRRTFSNFRIVASMVGILLLLVGTSGSADVREALDDASLLNKAKESKREFENGQDELKRFETKLTDINRIIEHPFVSAVLPGEKIEEMKKQRHLLNVLKVVSGASSLYHMLTFRINIILLQTTPQKRKEAANLLQHSTQCGELDDAHDLARFSLLIEPNNVLKRYQEFGGKAIQCEQAVARLENPTGPQVM